MSAGGAGAHRMRDSCARTRLTSFAYADFSAPSSAPAPALWVARRLRALPAPARAFAGMRLEGLDPEEPAAVPGASPAAAPFLAPLPLRLVSSVRHGTLSVPIAVADVRGHAVPARRRYAGWRAHARWHGFCWAAQRTPLAHARGHRT